MFFLFIWPFFIFVDLAFLKLLMAKFGFLNFFGPGNPGSNFRDSYCIDYYCFTRLPAKKTSLV